MADESAAACVDQKRASKPTEKAVEEKIHRLKGERKGKLAQITKQKNDLAKLKENEHNVNFIKDEELLRFERCLKQYERINEELCSFSFNLAKSFFCLVICANFPLRSPFSLCIFSSTAFSVVWLTTELALDTLSCGLISSSSSFRTSAIHLFVSSINC